MVKESLTFVSGAPRECMGIGMTFYMPTEFYPFSLGIYQLDVKVEEERWINSIQLKSAATLATSSTQGSARRNY